jgi:KDO2-lipid IV(A) lauroyltransferase
VAEPAEFAGRPNGDATEARAALRQEWRDWRRYWIRDPLLGVLDFAIHYGARCLPIAWCSSLGGLLGRLNGRYRFHKARERARLGYSHLSGDPGGLAGAERAVDRLFDNIGRTMLEFSVLDRLWAAGRIAVAGEAHLADARAAGKPVIVAGLHLGNWEVIAPSLTAFGLRFRFIYQPPRSRFEHRIAVAARQRCGAILLRPGVAAARAAHRLLVEEKGVLLIYADDERKGYVNAPLFGRPVAARANLVNIVRLAWASGAAVIPAYAERLAGARFRLNFVAPVELTPPGANAAAALLENVERLDRVITPPVLAHLDQWYMLADYYRG